MEYLALIPARGGSKGIPRKNIKPLNGTPLILYSVAAARACFKDADICVSTDDLEIKAVVESSGLPVPFIRPAELATDTSGTREVILHALQFHPTADAVVLLQPTSPFRTGQHIQEALSLFSLDLDMVVSVKKTKSNPYYVLFEENEEGFLAPSKKGRFTRRQDCPEVYEYNGAIYVINVRSIKNKTFTGFEKVKGYLMDERESVDIDEPLDWEFAEFLLGGS